MSFLRLFIVVTVFVTSAANATFFSTRADFDAANPSLPVIGFEGIAPPNGFVEPIAPNAFPGVTLISVDAQGNVVNAIADNGLFGTPTDVFFVDFFNSPLSIGMDFVGGVEAVGFNVAIGDAFDGLEATVSVFNGASLLDTRIFDTEHQSVFTSFAGFSGLGPITRVIVTPGADGFVLIDNLAFGDSQRVPEPGTLPLIGAAIAAVALLRRRKTSV